MKIEVEAQPGSVSTLRIELPPEEVSKEWDAIANSFARFAKIPGYRPGKAPRSVIEKRFRKEIQDELTKKLVSKSYHEAIERLRDQSADFVDVPERGLQIGDFAVIDFEGSSDGKPISEIAPQASKNLHGGKKFWLHLAPDNFLPKFCEQMVGQKPGETRTVNVEFAADFPMKELAGKRASYIVSVREIKEKVLPALDDDFASKLI